LVGGVFADVLGNLHRASAFAKATADRKMRAYVLA
jgi:hypothetical protein